MAAAGYPNGINPKTGKPLVLNFSATSNGGPDQRAQFDWLRKQFAKLGISLHVETTQYSRFQDKIRTGDIQLFFFGWSADYPDPENFLFLFYGANSKILNGSAINIGESIIIPKDIKTDATTISITRNGKNSKNPI